MLTIWKYELEITDEQTIQVPDDADLLSVASQRDKLCLWALVNPDRNLENRHIRIHGTGHPISGLARLSFIGTALMYGGELVWHVFEDKS